MIFWHLFPSLDPGIAEGAERIGADAGSISGGARWPAKEEEVHCDRSTVAKVLSKLRGPSSDRISPRRSAESAVSTKLNSILTAVGL